MASKKPAAPRSPAKPKKATPRAEAKAERKAPKAEAKRKAPSGAGKEAPKEAAKAASAAKRDPAKDPVVKTRVVAAGAAAPRTKTRVEKTRVVIPMDVYEAQKDAIKAPFKAHEMKWTFLGEGKGLYKRLDSGVHCFVQFMDDGVHYSVWGDDAARRDAILATWRGLLGEVGWARATASGEAAVEAEKQEAGSEAMRLWTMQEPQPRPGEPDFFLKKRREEWLARKPAD